MEPLCFPNATSPQPLNFLCESGSSTKSPKLSSKVEGPKLRQCLHSVPCPKENPPQCRSPSVSDFGRFWQWRHSPALQPIPPLVAQHRHSQRWHGRHSAPSSWLSSLFGGLEGGSNHTQTWSSTQRERQGGGEPGRVRHGRGGRARAGGDAAAAAAAARSGCAAAATGGRAETCRRTGSAGRRGPGAGWR